MDHRGTNFEAVDKEMVPVNATSSMSGRGFVLPNSNLLQLETVSASKFSSFTSVGLMQGPQDISEVNWRKSVSGLEAQLNATEAPGDACLQEQEISPKKRKRSVQDAEVDQAKGDQPLNMATKDNKSAGKQRRQRSQSSDPREEINVHVRAQLGQTTIGHGLAENVAGCRLRNHF